MSEQTVPFFKMNGIGNKIIVADARTAGHAITPEAARHLAGQAETDFDQIMEVRKSDNPAIDADIRILNSDGSEAEACGNGMRCVVSWLHASEPKRDWLFRTKPGLLKAEHGENGRITVEMGMPKFGWEDIPLAEEFADTTGIELQVGPIDAPVLHTPSVANIGNPHCIFWAPEDVWSYELDRFGPLLENHPLFPERANISIANVKSRDHLVVRTWERGAGLTGACGSAACAALVCAVRKGLTDSRATVTLPGGDLEIEWLQSGQVRMTGPAEHEFSGNLDPLTGDYVRGAA